VRRQWNIHLASFSSPCQRSHSTGTDSKLNPLASRPISGPVFLLPFPPIYRAVMLHPSPFSATGSLSRNLPGPIIRTHLTMPSAREPATRQASHPLGLLGTPGWWNTHTRRSPEAWEDEQWIAKIGQTRLISAGINT
jgi:hypothetical protein